MIMRLIVAVFTDAAQAATDGMSVVSVGGRAGICFFFADPLALDVALCYTSRFLFREIVAIRSGEACKTAT